MATERRCANRDCGKMVPLRGMRYNRAGTDLICAECIPADRGVARKQAQGTPEPAKSAEIPGSSVKVGEDHDFVEVEKSGREDSQREPAAPKQEKTDQDSEEGRITGYECGSCGLGFSGERGSAARCPYCGKDNARTASRNSTQSLISEARNAEEFRPDQIL